MTNATVAKRAMRFVVVMGAVNLFADMTYEGARGIAGPFLGHLGASGAIVGAVAGGGELAGYAIRTVSGRIADRTGKYWIEAWAGYALNMLAVPALALAGSWPAAAGLLIGERIGRGVRKPIIASVIANAGDSVGTGKAFGVNELFDQIGATAGPLIVAYAMARTGNSYRAGFGWLLLPAIATLLAFAAANVAGREFTPRPGPREGPQFRDARAFWTYAIGGALIGAGFVDFALIALHFSRDHIVAPSAISLWFAAAMAVAALASYAFGHAFDRFGARLVGVAIALGAAAVPLAFLGTGAVATAGAALWGLGTAVQDVLLVALVAGVVTRARGASGFGLYDVIFGVAWFAGSVVAGILLDHSVVALVAFSLVLQLAAIPFFVRAPR